MQGPEVETGNGVVVARIAKIQEAEKLFVDKEEPEEAVVLAGPAVKGEGEIGRIAKGGQNMPGSRDQQRDQSSAQRMQSPPSAGRKQLVCEGQVNERGGHRKHNRDQALEQQAGAE